MFDDAENLKLLEDFEVHWDKIAKEIENTELSKDDVEKWGNNFELGRNSLLRSLSTNYYTNEVETRISRVKDQFDISVSKAKANYRKNDKIRLKASSDFIGPIIDIIHKTVKKLF